MDDGNADRAKEFLRKPPVRPMHLGPETTVTDLVAAYRAAGAFNAGRLAEGCRLFAHMVESGATICLTLAGALLPAGLGGPVVQLMERGLVDLVVSTGANLYHDLHFALGLPVHQGDFRADDEALLRAGIVRIYDVFVPAQVLLDTDEFVRSAVAESGLAGLHSCRTLHHALGERAEKARPGNGSFLASAYRMGVPVYVSSPGDSSIGLNTAALKARGNDFTIDPDLDVLETAAIVRASDRNGVCILGGGSPKNFYLQTQPMLSQILGLQTKGHDFFLQVTTDSPQFGGLSGATPNEAVSWGKIDPDRIEEEVVVYCDATIAFPIIAAYALANCGARSPRRLYGQVDGLVAELRGALGQ